MRTSTQDGGEWEERGVDVGEAGWGDLNHLCFVQSRMRSFGWVLRKESCDLTVEIPGRRIFSSFFS